MLKQQRFTDPETEQMCKLLGGVFFKGVTLSNDQINSLMRLYGYHHEREEDWKSEFEVEEVDRSRWPHETKTRTIKTNATDLAESAMLVSVGRRAAHDGLRMIAMLARFCEPNQDPVKLLVQLCCDAGYDVGTLVGWAYDEEDIEDSQTETR